MGQLRVDGWERLLAEHVEAARLKPFEWGAHGCACWAIEVRTALTGGDDLAALWRGKYSTAASSVKVMRKLGWTSLEAAGRDLLGEPLPSVLLAQRGDIVLMQTGFGVVLGARAVGMSEAGLGSLPLADCLLGWRV